MRPVRRAPDGDRYPRRMALGPALRTRLGKYESTAAGLYRAAFFNLSHLVDQLGPELSGARRVLEIGCGDGDVATEVTRRYPDLTYVGLDVSPEPGRRFAGRTGAAEFFSMPSGDYLAQHSEAVGAFDVVLVVDVLHHVPADLRPAILDDAARLLRPGGHLAVKEWIRNGTLPYLGGACADWYLSGDRSAAYMRREELDQLCAEGCPDLVEQRFVVLKPWACNGMKVLAASA